MKIHLSAEPARPRSAQSGLFQPPTPEPEKLELTLARIAGLVGSGNVGGAELLDTHHPAGFRMQRFIPTTPAPRSKNAKPRNPKNKNQKNQIEDENSAAPPDRTADAPITALRIFRPPLQATVTLRDGQPVHIVCMRRKEIAGDILWMAGPWRSSGDWWEQDGWSRDEWDIAIELPVAKNQLSVGKGHLLFSSGQASEKSGLALYRLVHDLLSGHWFVEGTYD